MRIHNGPHGRQPLGITEKPVIKGLLRSFRPAKPLGARAAAPATVQQTEPQLLRQLETKERPEIFVRWDLACLYATTGRLNQALDQVRHLADMTDGPERQAAYYHALGQLLQLRQLFAEAATCHLGAVETNPADPDGLRRLESFLESHPGIRPRVPDLIPRLWKCRMAVERAAVKFSPR